MQDSEASCSPTGRKVFYVWCGADCSLIKAQRVDKGEISNEDRNGNAEKEPDASGCHGQHGNASRGWGRNGSCLSWCAAVNAQPARIQATGRRVPDRYSSAWGQ